MTCKILKVKLLHENAFVPFGRVISIDNAVDHCGLLNEEESTRIHVAITSTKIGLVKSFFLKRILKKRFSMLYLTIKKELRA